MRTGEQYIPRLQLALGTSIYVVAHEAGICQWIGRIRTERTQKVPYQIHGYRPKQRTSGRKLRTDPGGFDGCCQIAPRLLVYLQLLAICADSRGLNQLSCQTNFHRVLAASAHFVASSHDKGLRVASNGKTELFWCRLREFHALQLSLKVLHGFVDVGIPTHAIRGHPHATQIFVTRAIAEPASHLH